MLKFTVVAIVLLMLGLTASAEVPQLISYQGNLTDGDGNPVADGDYNMTFSIYNDPNTPSGIWYSGSQPVHVENGQFSYMLGTVNPFPATLFDDTSNLPPNYKLAFIMKQ